jgi:hypothetical protein
MCAPCHFGDLTTDIGLKGSVTWHTSILYELVLAPPASATCISCYLGVLTNDIGFQGLVTLQTPIPLVRSQMREVRACSVCSSRTRGFSQTEKGNVASGEGISHGKVFAVQSQFSIQSVRFISVPFVNNKTNPTSWKIA